MENRKVNLMTTSDPFPFTRPKIIEVDGRRYRTYENLDFLESGESPQTQQLSAYTDNDESMMNSGEMEDYDIKVTKTGRFLTEIHAATYFFPFIIGVRGSRKKEIEDSTKSKIKIPKDETENITIIGNTERDVASARNRIYMIILEQREKHRVTHFASIRVFSFLIKENFEVFKSSVLNGPIIRGIHSSIFQKPEKFHLTLATLVLLDDTEIEDAINTLQDCKVDVVQPLLESVEPPLLIEMHGVEIMNDDPTNVDVLYGKVKVSPSKYQTVFQELVDKIADYFAKKGFIRKQYDSVKLHVTLMNTLFRKNDSNQEIEGERESFDASLILQKYKNFYFGEAELDFIHLSIRFGKTDQSGDYYYESLATIPLF